MKSAALTVLCAQKMLHGHRKFHDLPSRPPDELLNDSDAHEDKTKYPAVGKDDESKKESLLSYINDNIIGKDRIFSGPYGDRKVVYCDYVASGRCLSFIEDYIRREVMPDYGNTHTTTTVTSLQTTLFRHEARDILRNACRASDHDAILFVSSGCTGAINKLIYNLNLQEKPIVFVSPFEHHSNILPWKEVSAEFVRASTTPDGQIDFDALEQQLKTHAASGRPLIGSFSAASNVTGILTDVNRIAVLLHRYGAKAFFDYAAGAPYLAIDMNPVVGGPDQALVYKDAVFFSMHKFVGGVQTPGVLIAKRELFRHREAPHEPGGGTVFFVRREKALFLQDVEEREEGGTPAIIESIRAGLVMQLKQAVTTKVIAEKEDDYCSMAWEAWKDCPDLIVLGGSKHRRLPIFSFLCRAGTPGRYLHHNYVATLLNDVFGIQARGGCACAGPYGMDLLGIDEQTGVEMEETLIGSGLEQFVRSKYFEFPHREVLRPGFTRINLPYFLPRDEIEFVLAAVRWVAVNGWRMLPRYRFNPETSEWLHQGEELVRGRKWLGFVSYASGAMKWRVPARKDQSRGAAPASYADCLAAADALLDDPPPRPGELPDDRLVFDDSCRHLLWFLLPSEAALLAAGEALPPDDGPVRPGSILPCTGDVEAPAGPAAAVGAGGDAETAPQANGEAMTSSSGDGEATTSSDVNGTAVASPEESGDNETSILRPPSDEETEEVVPVLDSPDAEAGTTAAAAAAAPQGRQKAAARRKEGQKKKKEKVYKSLWRPPPKEIFKPFLQAMEQYQMIEDGDRVIVCLSGGKDSLSLLHTLHQYQRYSRANGVSFDLAGATVDPGTAAYDPSPLIPYMAQLEVPYFYEKQDIIETATQLPYECDSICAFCSRMKRGRLYACARREGYNVLAMGQHLDDLTESFLMSVFHNGFLRTIKANYRVKEGDLRVIRPFVYVREKHTRQFADQANLPIIPENCPACFDAPKERFRIKQLMAEQEVIHPNVYNSIKSALEPLMAAQIEDQLLLPNTLREDSDYEEGGERKKSTEPAACQQKSCSLLE